MLISLFWGKSLGGETPSGAVLVKTVVAFSAPPKLALDLVFTLCFVFPRDF